jgi:5,10-methylene-tetrahydrofolate dehydrogenase/methenyl tetrahydrofolate cyclohydrolase
MVKTGAVVIDVGINRLPDGRIAAMWISRGSLRRPLT